MHRWGLRGQGLLATKGPHHHWESFVSWPAGIFLTFLVILLLGTAGLAIYAGRMTPHQQMVEQVIPNDRFQN
jgi:hypothetical protein